MIKKTVQCLIRKCIILMILSVSVYINTAYADQDNGKETAYEREQRIVSQLKSVFTKKSLKKGTLDVSEESSQVHDLTLLLRDAVKNYDSFSDESREYVDRFLMRPDDTTNEWPWSSELFFLPAPVLIEDSPGGHFRFHYVTHSTADDAGNVHTTTTSFVQSMATEFENVYTETITNMGYTAPPDDGAIADNGGDARMDIYVLNCGEYAVYGYTAMESNAQSSPSFMVMDNDFSEFAGYNYTAEEAMKVTAAHEYHHAVQFGLNSDADAWIMEASSTWMEDQIYDAIDDNLQYLNSSEGFFANPQWSINSENQWYNNWIWLEYMETNWGQSSIMSIWEDYLSSTTNGVTAVTSVLTDNSTTLREAFTEFARANYTQSDFYSAHALYNSVRIANEQSQIGYNLDYSTDSSDIFEQQTLMVNHLAAKYLKLTPGASISAGADDTLTVHIKGTDGRSIDVVPVVISAGSVIIDPVFSLNSTNDGTLEILNFNRSSISEVVLVAVNYSTNEENSVFIFSGGIGTDGAANTVSSGSSTDPSPVVVTGSSSSGGCFISTAY